MKLVICEKPSVGAAVAAALGVREKKDGYIEGKGHADEVWKERQDPRPLHAGTGKSPYAARRGYSVGNARHFRRALWYAAF